MLRCVLLIGIVVVCVFSLLGCGATATAAPTTAPTPQAAATVAVASTGRTPIPLPPQPTSPPQATRAPTLWQTPAPALIVSVPLPTRAATGAPAATSAGPQNQPTPSGGGPVPTAPGVATGRRSEVKFVFLTPLKPAEEAEPAELVAIRAELKKLPGFLEISGDENLVTVGYDAGLVTVEQLMQRFAELKHPVKRA